MVNDFITFITLITILNINTWNASDQFGDGKMCIEIDGGKRNEELRKFIRYIVIDIGENGCYCIKGIRSDAPEEMIDEFIAWYRRNYRYENGRMRPENVMRRNLIITV